MSLFPGLEEDRNAYPSKLRIIGGNDTDISKHPWQVSLQALSNHFCGGVLIGKEWILTAAHCVDNMFIQRFTSVRVGSKYTDRDGEVIKAAKIIIHPGWDFIHTKEYDNDIALVKLANPVNISTARSISLPSAILNISSGSPLAVTGWGYTEENGSAVVSLREVEVPYVTLDLCQELYSDTEYKISNNMLCAGLVGIGGKDACKGDSGGPAVYRNEVLVGIVSWGSGCAEASHPGVYVRVTEYLDWINLTMYQ